MIYHVAQLLQVLLKLLREANEACQSLRFHKEKGKILNGRIQLLGAELEEMLQEDHAERYRDSLVALQLHLRTALTTFQECCKGKLYRIFHYKKIMKDIQDVNNDISRSLQDIQFLRPSRGRRNLHQVLQEFLDDEVLGSVEDADEMGQYPDYDVATPQLVVQAVNRLLKEERVSAADVASYKADLETLERENEHLRGVLSVAAENQGELAAKKPGLEKDFMEQVIALLSLDTKAPVSREEPIVPPSFKCPISLDLMTDPVILMETGISFERANIEQWFRTSNSRTCPSTNQVLQSTSFTPNIGLRNAIQDWAKEHGLEAHTPSPTSHLNPGASFSTPRDAAQLPAPGLANSDVTLTELKRRAKGGDTGAMFEVAMCYFTPRLVASCDLGRAVKWLKEASQGGVLKAHALLAFLYLCGKGVEEDEAEAVRRAKLAEGGEEPIAQVVLGAAYFNGLGGLEEDEDASGRLVATAKKALKKRVETSSNFLDQWVLALCYEAGVGTREDHAKAAALYRKAADQGFAVAQFSLGQCFYRGEGVPKDLAQAVAWLQKAANKGEAEAQDLLGDCYKNGQGVPKDLVQAAAWYQKAADQGFACAQTSLGARYYSGTGLPENLAQAAAWFQKAADKGDADGQNFLGDCYRHGKGVPKNVKLAAAWYQKAANQGHASAIKSLAQSKSFWKRLFR